MVLNAKNQFRMCLVHIFSTSFNSITELIPLKDGKFFLYSTPSSSSKVTTLDLICFLYMTKFCKIAENKLQINFFL